MRQLVLTWQRSGQVVSLISAALLPLACGGNSADGDSGNASGHSGGATTMAGGATSTATATLASGGSPAETTLDLGGTTATGGMGGSAQGGATTNATGGASSEYPFAVRKFLSCPYENPDQYVVPIPEEGVLADPTALCSASPPVTSNWAARVEIDTEAGGSVWEGMIVLAPDIGTLITTPSAVVTSLEGELAWPTVAVGTFDAARNGYAVTITWPSNVFWSASLVRMSMQIQFDVFCGLQQRTISSTALLYGCVQVGSAPRVWASSGDTCDNCATICEMAPSPMPIAGESVDQLPLAQRLRATVHVLSRGNGALVLWAEHDGGTEHCHYEWQASSGQLLYAERDVAVWMPASEPELQLVQVGIDCERAAGVASMAWEHAA